MRTSLRLAFGLAVAALLFVAPLRATEEEHPASTVTSEHAAPEHSDEHSNAAPHEAKHEAGGHEAHHVPEWSELAKPLTYRIINFIGFIALLVFLGKKPLKTFLVNRRKHVEEAIAQSAERKAWAEKQYAEYNKRLDNIGKEIADLKTSLQEEGRTESERIMANAKHLAENLRKDTAMMADAEMEDLKEDLKRETVETAAMVARETLIRVLKDDDQSRLDKEFVDELRRQS